MFSETNLIILFANKKIHAYKNMPTTVPLRFCQIAKIDENINGDVINYVFDILFCSRNGENDVEIFTNKVIKTMGEYNDCGRYVIEFSKIERELPTQQSKIWAYKGNIQVTTIKE
jgi:hypothetical protein